jgi:hypothetical protein
MCREERFNTCNVKLNDNSLEMLNYAAGRQPKKAKVVATQVTCLANHCIVHFQINFNCDG